MAKRLVGSAVLLLADAAFAHPGHGSTDPRSFLHGLEPEHLVPWLAGVALVALVGWRVARAAAERRRGR